MVTLTHNQTREDTTMKTINDTFEEKIINKCEPATRGERNAIRA